MQVRWRHAWDTNNIKRWYACLYYTSSISAVGVVSVSMLDDIPLSDLTTGIMDGERLTEANAGD